MERYLLKSAGEDERGGGLGLVGNVAAAGIAGGAGYMGYQKFKPELHAAYHNIIGTAKSQATKGIMGYAKKGIAGVIGGVGLLGAGAIAHAAAKHPEGVVKGFKEAVNIPKQIKGIKDNAISKKSLANAGNAAKGPVPGKSFMEYYKNDVKPHIATSTDFHAKASDANHVSTPEFRQQWAQHHNDNIVPAHQNIVTYNKANPVPSLIPGKPSPTHAVQDQMQQLSDHHDAYMKKHAGPAKTASAFKPIHYRYY
jgi:hypothetical protein